MRRDTHSSPIHFVLWCQVRCQTPSLTRKSIGLLADLAKGILLLQIPVELGDRVLVGVDGRLVQVDVLGTHDLDIVLEHEQTLGILGLLVIQRVVHTRHLGTETQHLDVVRKVESMLQVLLNVVHVHGSTLE